MDYKSKVADIWNRVQSNEESASQKKKTIEECESLLMDAEFKKNSFLLYKLQLIQYKVGIKVDLPSLIVNLENIALKTDNGVDPFICIAEACLLNNQPEKALENLEYTYSMGDYPEVLILASLCYRRLKNADLEKSLEIAKKAVKVDMKYGRSWAALGMAYLSFSSRENILAAQKAFNMALKNGEDKNADAYMNLGTICELVVDFPSALKNYEMAAQIADGWQLPVSHVDRLKTMLKKVLTREEELASMSRKRKNELVARTKTENEFVVLEVPCDRDAPSQLVICFDHSGNTRIFGIIQTMRPYLRCEKTVLRLNKVEWREIIVDDKKSQFHIIEHQHDAEIIGGAMPKDVKPVSITSSIA